MPSTPSLELVSLLAPNADDFYGALAGWLSRATGLDVRARAEPTWAAREAVVHGGAPAVVALCGGLYARDAAVLGLEAIAAPVLRGRRYGGRAIFYSDLIVARRSGARSRADLRGRPPAFTDVDPLSGFTAVKDRLRALGEGPGFFRTELVTGSHQASLDLVASGLADVAAIDSAVLEAELGRRPLLARAVRVVASLGPLPAHPIAVRATLDAEAKALLIDALTIAHGTSSGVETLRAGGVERFVPVDGSLYAPLREIARRAHCSATPAGRERHPRLRGCA